MPVGERQIRFGSFQLDTRCGQLRKDGIGLKLQGQPVQILQVLLETPGELVTREELRQRLWSSDTFVDFDHSLNTAIKRLRQALEDDAETPKYIETIPKRGYRFIAEVSQREPKEDAPPSIAHFDANVEKIPTTPAYLSISPSKKLAPLRTWGIAALSMLALLLAAGTGYWITRPDPVPHIVGSHALTHTGNPKGWETYPSLGSLFFWEATPWGRVTLRVPLEGGEGVQLPWLKGQLADISRDGAQLLSVTDEGVWTQLSSGGNPRLIIRDHVWPLWTADARGIFLIRDRAEANERFAELYRAAADGTGMEHLATLPGVAFHPHLSPDGLHIRFSDLRGYRLWDIGVDGRDAHLVLPEIKDAFGAAWSPDGRYCFFTRGDNERFNLWWRAEEGHWWSRKTAAVRQLTYGPMSVGFPSISSDGKKLFAMGWESQGELAVYDGTAHKFVPFLSGISAFFVDFSRDGQWITYVSYPDGSLWRSRIDGGERRQLTSKRMGIVNPRWSPDGKMIAFVTTTGTAVNGGANRVYLVSSDGGSPMLLLSGEELHDATWAPDGNSIAYGSKLDGVPRVSILDLRSQQSRIVPGSENMFSPRWSPDGKYLAALSAPWFDSTKLMLFRFSANTWEELASHRDGFGWLSWSSDSKYVFATNGPLMVRIGIGNHRKAEIGSFRGLRLAMYGTPTGSMTWFGLTPDGRPLTTLDKGVAEMYAFDLEYK